MSGAIRSAAQFGARLAERDGQLPRLFKPRHKYATHAGPGPLGDVRGGGRLGLGYSSPEARSPRRSA